MSPESSKSIPEQFLSVKRGSPEFYRYLLGDATDDFRALPVRSLNVNTDQEVVTYKIIKKDLIRRPNFYFLLLLKPRVLLMALVPMFFLLGLQIKLGGSFAVVPTCWGFLGVFLAVSSGILKNDFDDHMTGLDRIHTGENLRPIQCGWVTPRKVLKLSNLLLAGAFLSAFPVIWKIPKITPLIFLGFIMVYLNQKYERSRFKFSSSGELIIAVLFGPLLSIGFWTCLTGDLFNFRAIGFGLCWSLFVLFLIHLQNFKSAMWASQFKLENTMTRLGFDRGKWFLPLWFIVSLFSYSLFEILYGKQSWALGVWILFSAPIVLLIKSFRQLKSPLSSQIQTAVNHGFKILILFESFLFIRTFFD